MTSSTRPCTPEELFRVPKENSTTNSPVFPKTMQINNTPTYQKGSVATADTSSKLWIWIVVGLVAIGAGMLWYTEKQKAKKAKNNMETL
jgi:hypothetical protein